LSEVSTQLIHIGRKKEPTGLDRDFQDISGEVDNWASRLVYTG